MTTLRVLLCFLVGLATACSNPEPKHPDRVADASDPAGGATFKLIGKPPPPPTSPDAGLEQRCNAGDADSCLRLADRYGDNPREVRRLISKACDYGSGRGCAQLAAWIRSPEHQGGTVREARKASERACDKGWAPSCTEVGYWYLVGDGVVQSAAEAQTRFAKGCDGNHGPACFALARLYSIGPPGVVRDDSKGLSLVYKACAQRGDNESADACLRLGEIKVSASSPVSAADIRIVLEQGCSNMIRRGCTALALRRMWAGGKLTQDRAVLAAVRKQLEDECEDGGESAACVYAALFYSNAIGTAQDFAKAAHYLVRGCRVETYGYSQWWANARACDRIGTHFLTGLGVPKSPEKAAIAFRRACERGNADACGQVGRLMILGIGGYARDPTGGLDKAKAACSFGSGAACDIVANALTEGVPGIPKDATAGADYRRQACKRGYARACQTP